MGLPLTSVEFSFFGGQMTPLARYRDSAYTRYRNVSIFLNSKSPVRMGNDVQFHRIPSFR